MKKGVKIIRRYYANHPIIFWLCISVLFALLIHIAFSVPAISQFFVAKWGAGELLAYSSTVAIGLLAFWQNKRFKQENDIAQKKLETLTEQANALSIIGKIVEIENDNLRNLKHALDDFTSACDPTEIISRYNESIKAGKAGALFIAESNTRIDKALLSVGWELRFDPKNLKESNDIFENTLYVFYFGAKSFVSHLDGNTSSDSLSLEQKQLEMTELGFLMQREQLINRKEKKLNTVIYGNLTLDEIKQMYYKQSDKEGTQNERETENAQPE